MVLSVAFAQDNGVSEMVLPVGTQDGVEHGSSFPPFDASFFSSHLFWLALSFAAFYFLMARIVMPRIGAGLDRRRQRIEADLEQAAALKEQADGAMVLYEQQLSQARSQAQSLARTAMDEAKALSERERTTVEASLAQRLSAAEEKIVHLQQQAMAHVDQIAAETAEAILVHLTGNKVDKSSLNQALKRVAQA